MNISRVHVNSGNHRLDETGVDDHFLKTDDGVKDDSMCRNDVTLDLVAIVKS